MGTVANIVQSLKLPDGNIKVLVEGVERGKILKMANEEGHFRVSVQTKQFRPVTTPSLEQLVRAMIAQLPDDCTAAQVAAMTLGCWPMPR